MLNRLAKQNKTFYLAAEKARAEIINNHPKISIAQFFYRESDWVFSF